MRPVFMMINKQAAEVLTLINNAWHQEGGAAERPPRWQEQARDLTARRYCELTTEGGEGFGGLPPAHIWLTHEITG